MATQAEMIAKAANIPLDPSSIILGEVRQNDIEYWLLSGVQSLQGGQITIPVSFQEPKT